MINIKKVVARLEQEEFDALSQILNENKAEKFLFLFKLLREDNLSNQEIKAQMKISQSAYYTLKSRLYEYIQQYNKHVAYTLALDKIDDLMAEFNNKLGEYFLSRNIHYLDILKLIK